MERPEEPKSLAERSETLLREQYRLMPASFLYIAYDQAIVMAAKAPYNPNWVRRLKLTAEEVNRRELAFEEVI